MAFNFNWSPLMADAGFYTRAQELLTAALNKSPKPPIIVDDILVNELNLGHIPPELEILEIGDLAEDRPSFASPQPLAAATGLTIPLQITLSDIKLSAFIILVFSRQKGLTLVFRNDPLESLKVSSTFDSIPFVANYLQKEIEGQLRTLLMDELPAIIHRLSLRLWVPEHKAREERAMSVPDISKDEPVVDPFASPPQDPVDSTGHALNPTQIASLSLDSGIETQSLFSQRNLLRLATLTDSHRTLSLFTPSIRDVVFRAWAGPIERGEFTGFPTRAPTPALSRTHSSAGNLSTAYTFDSATHARPGLQNFAPGSYSLGSGSSRHGKTHGTRKRKKRVVNLRSQPRTGEQEFTSEDGSTMTDTASITESTSSAPSIFSAPPASRSPETHHDSTPITPPMSPSAIRTGKMPDRTPVRSGPSAAETSSASYRRSLPRRSATLDSPAKIEEETLLPHLGHDETLRASHRRRMQMPSEMDFNATPRASMYLPEPKTVTSFNQPSSTQLPGEKLSYERKSSTPPPPPLPNFLQFIADPANGGSIAERAWMVKLASEVSRRYEEERSKGSIGSPKEDETPPPAYAR